MLRCLARPFDWLDRFWTHAFHHDAHAPHLLVPLFHAVALSDKAASVLAPHLAVTLEEMRRFLDAVLRAGYQPVCLGQLDEQQIPPAKSVLVTFDDGYFNNAAALRVLEEFGVPGTFFISAGHVWQEKGFWWDVVARATRRSAASDREIQARLERLKRSRPVEIEQELVRDLGRTALRPVGDQDRPFSAAELRDFAQSKWVTLGNHTAEHTILTGCTEEDAEAALVHGRRLLDVMTGATPRAVAYPDGACSGAVAAAAQRTGHSIGFTCEPRSNVLPLRHDARMTIGRHIIPAGGHRDEQLSVWGVPKVLPGTRLRAFVRRAAARA